MKKLLFLSCSLFVILTTSSCQKDWTCECDGWVVQTYNNTSKIAAKSSCEGNAAHFPGETCSLK